MTVGQRIRQRRIDLALSQDDLAKKVGYKSRSSIQKIECARNLPLPKVEKMATALGCTPSFLMGWEDADGDTTAYKNLMDAYIYRDRLDKYTPEQVMKALDFLDAFQTATPEARSAIEILLKSRRSDP